MKSTNDIKSQKRRVKGIRQGIKQLFVNVHHRFRQYENIFDLMLSRGPDKHTRELIAEFQRNSIARAMERDFKKIGAEMWGAMNPVVDMKAINQQIETQTSGEPQKKFSLYDSV
ncbi:MAG: hypothetical protein OXG88_11125 [Gammaproteobacteria bacterium]|nr:hypothetical protein [Gammaproteobacteria bacterium]